MHSEDLTLDVDSLFGACWQRRPRLVRQAIDVRALSATRDAVVRLASTPGVPSRIVSRADATQGAVLRRGPFPVEELRDPPSHPWTLLVQETDRHLDSVAEFLERFRHRPNWRLDDVMISLATDGGGIGPHVDRYDVFLVQVVGRRRWRVVERPDPRAEIRADGDVPTLARFEPDRTWELEPGDVLYLPPHVPHEGVALGWSETWSVGFRTPDPRELVAGYLRSLSPAALDGLRWSDPDARSPERPGLISDEVRTRLRDRARELFAAEAFDVWLGQLVTTPPRGLVRDDRASAVLARSWRRVLDDGGTLRRSAAAHFAWFRDVRGDTRLFVGGEHYALGAGRDEAAENLCGRAVLDRSALESFVENAASGAVLSDVILRGYLRRAEPP